MIDFPPEFFDPPRDKFDPTFVGPTGKGTKLYVIAEANGAEEVKRQEVLIGPAGQVWRKALKAADVDIQDITMWNTCPFRPVDRVGSRAYNRTPSAEEIELYSQYVKTDIRKKKPACILLLGRSAMRGLGIDLRVDEARPKTFDFEGIPCYATWHPSYILRNGGESYHGFGKLVNDIKRAYQNHQAVPAKADYTIIDVLDWDKVEDIFQNDQEIVLDYEASGLNTYHNNYFVGGIALKGRASKVCVYVMLYNFWRTPEEFPISIKLRARIGVWLLSKRLVVFNLQYECAASLTYFKVYIRDIIDVMMMNRSLGYSGGLKEVASSRLGARIWNTEVDEWNDLIGKIIKGLQPTHKGRVRDEVLFIQERDHSVSIDEVVAWYAAVKKPNERTNTGRDTLIQFNKLVKKYYSGDRYNEFCKRFFRLVIARAASRDLSTKFTDIPIEIIAPYATDDVEYTSLLKDSLQAEINKLDITRVTEVYNNLAKLGFEMEASGIAWNDTLASELDKVYLGTAIDCLRSLLMTPKFQKILPSLSLSTEDRRVPLAECHQDILEIQTTTELDHLTKYFNPRSNHKNTKDSFSRLIVTARLRFLMMLHEIFKVYQNSKEECLREYPVLGPVLEQIIAEPSVEQRFMIVETLVEGSEGISTKIARHPANARDLWRDDSGKKITPPEADVFIKFANWDLPGMASAVIEDVYNAFWHIGGINIDDDKTWVDEFRWIYSFRLYKKVMKSYSTYIWGDVGRGNAALLDKEEVHNLSAARRPGWQERTPENQVWIKETKFGVCTAVTKRFQSGDHTVPGGELIDLRVSRFIDGVRLHWDLSQSEIRILAFIANDQNLLQKFLEGADIHLYIASQIWSKSEKSVTKAERRFAKSAVFAVLYGDSPPSFAVKFLNGNVELAKYIFKQLFTAFPNIAKWIKAQHRFALQHGYLFTYFKDPIYDIGMPSEAVALSASAKEDLLDNVYSRKVRLSQNKELDKKLRQLISKSFRNAQNYPIQSVSSTLAGLGEYYLLEYLRDKEMSARIDCFTHDSGELDIQIADLPAVISVLPKLVVDNVVKEFKIPIKAEYEVGVSGGQMVELKDAVADGPIIYSNFKESKLKAVNALERKLTVYGVKCEIAIDKETENTRSMGEMFIARGAFNLAFGQKEKVVEGKMKLDFSQVKREI
jgi:uracil-DNA glycosylase family 4